MRVQTLEESAEWRMYNLVACYDTLELKSRGDVLSDKVSSVLPDIQAMLEMEEHFHMPFTPSTFCTHHSEHRQTSVECLLPTDPPPAQVYLSSPASPGAGLRISQSESILTDMTHVLR